MAMDNHAYFRLGNLLNQDTLENILFIFKVIRGLMNSPNFVNLIHYNLPARTLRHHNWFHITQHTTNYGGNTTFNRAMTFLNSNDDINCWGNQAEHVDFWIDFGVKYFSNL